METQVQTEKLERLITVFDGRIETTHKIFGEDVVKIEYTVYNDYLYGNKKNTYSIASLLNKGISSKEGTKVKVGLYSTKTGR